MSRIDIGEIQTFAHQLHTANEAGRKSIKDIKKAVKNYTEDGSLKGKRLMHRKLLSNDLFSIM